MAAKPSIHGRVRARRCAVQALYQWRVTDHHPKDILSEFIADRELIKVDMDYFRQLTLEVPEHFDALQKQLATVVKRPFDQLDNVEVAILLIGAYELVFCPEIPWRVVVNESIELTKMFGAAESHKFINGSMDKLAHDVRKLEISAASS